MGNKIKLILVLGLTMALYAFVSLKSENELLLQNINDDLKGYKVAFGDTQNIYMMDPSGSNVEKLVDAGPISGYVSWSEDAKYVYFASAMGPIESAWEAFRVNVKTKKLTKISSFGKDVRSMGVSPDGKTLAISIMTGNSNIGNNNDDLSKFSSNLYVISMEYVEALLQEGKLIKLDDLIPIQMSPDEDQFWYEELNWNHDPKNPLLAYTKTWRYDDDDVSYTNAYIIKPDGTQNTLIAKNCDQPIWSFNNERLYFLGLNYYDFKSNKMKKVNVTGINNEVSGGSSSPHGGNYMIFEIGDEGRKGGIVKIDKSTNIWKILKL